MSTVAGTYNILADQGATWVRTITWQDATGTPVNLTGYTAAMQVRETAASTTVLIEASTANGRISLGGSAGTVTVTIPAATMTAVAAGVYAYDLELTSAASVVTRLVMGSFTVRAEVTR